MRRFSLFFFVIFFALPAHAETVADYCKGIQNTTDLVECLNKYNEKTKEKLSKTFQETFDGLTDEKATLFKQAQQNWIQYRNSECTWEVKNENTESLKRPRELHCLIRMTTHRQNTIDSIKNNLHEYNKAQGVKPRWENILYADYPDIYWKTGRVTSTDLNCDGQQENVLLGIHVDESDKNKYVIAFVENINTGRPLPITLDLPPSEITGENETLCGNDIVFMAPDLKNNENCENLALHIKNGNCGVYSMSYTGKGFAYKKLGDADTQEDKDAKVH